MFTYIKLKNYKSLIELEVDLTKKESFDAVAKEFDRLLDILENELKKINLI